MSLPPPMISHAPGVGVWHDAFVSTPGGEAQVRADFLSWLPRRVGLNGQRVIDGGVPSPVSSGAGSYGMGWGGRIFYPVDVADDGVSADLGNGFIEAYRAAASGRRRRSEPIDTVVIEEEDPVPIPSVESPINALHDTAMAALLGESGYRGGAFTDSPICTAFRSSTLRTGCRAPGVRRSVGEYAMPLFSSSLTAMRLHVAGDCI